MRIAPDIVTVAIGNTVFELRPSLGAAIRLAYRYDDFSAVFRGVTQGDLSTIADVIAETSGRSHADIRAVLVPPLGRSLALAIPACLTVLADMLDLGDNHKPNDNPGPAMSPADFYKQLFKLACGSIGWPPEAALGATPQQILVAYKGRVELLRQLFGSSEDDEKPTKQDFARDPDASAKLRALAGA